MNKTDLIEAIAERAGLSKAAASRALDAALEAIAEALGKNEDVTLVGFGTFTTSERSERQGRNPQTGEAITIPATKAPRFRAGKSLKACVNK